MRLSLYILAFFLMAATIAPASARDQKHACALITEAEVGTLLGTPVRIDRPNGMELVICAGYCPMQGKNSSRCDFVATERTGMGLYLEVDPPPNYVPDWPKRAFDSAREDKSATVENIPWPQGTAVWYFRPDQSHGFLEVFVGHRVWFSVIVDGVKDGGEALNDAKRVVSIAQARYDAK